MHISHLCTISQFHIQSPSLDKVILEKIQLSTNIVDYFHPLVIYNKNEKLNSKNFITNKVKLHQDAPKNKMQVNQNKFSYEQLDEGKPHLKTPTNNLFFKIPPQKSQDFLATKCKVNKPNKDNIHLIVCCRKFRASFHSAIKS